MERRRLRSFLARRLSHEEYLGLHLTVGLFLSLGLLGIFAVIAHSVRQPDHLVPFDQALGLQCEQNRQASPTIRAVFLAITQLGSFMTLSGLVILIALLLLLVRRRLLALVWLIASPVGGLLDMGLKHWFERERPAFRDPLIVETTKSFPSGHSMGSLIGYGLIAYFLVLLLPRLWLRVVAVSGLALLVLAIGFSRIYLGVHYCSDVLGGFAVGGVWLATCITAVETLRRRPTKSSPEPAETVVSETLAQAD
jgi:undecaprenyl-diphosphatase